jgi:hypothetical protein
VKKRRFVLIVKNRLKKTKTTIRGLFIVRGLFMDKIKYICLNDFVIERRWTDSKDFYKKDEIYCFKRVNPVNYMNFNFPGNFWLTDTEVNKYFVPLYEFREKRINSIFLN